MNIFKSTYEARLQSWSSLRNQMKKSTRPNQYLEADFLWQKVPLVNHHLQLLDHKRWNGRLDLLVENTYRNVVRALGICYTLLILGINDIEIVEVATVNGKTRY